MFLTEPSETTDSDTTDSDTSDRSGCLEGGSGCEASTLHPDNEGLIDDEDYSVTEPTNHGSGSGSGEAELTSEPSTDSELVSITGHRERRQLRRKRSDRGVASKQADFQSMVREMAEKKRQVAMKFSDTKMVAKTRKKGVPKLLASPEEPERGVKPSDIQFHGDDEMQWATEVEEDPAIIHLHKQETVHSVTSEYLHRM